jgi:6-phosphogluconate dehydrogenase
MQLGMIGLGRMGANMVRRLTRAGHRCVVHDRNPETVAALASELGSPVEGAATLAEFVDRLAAPRAAWIMVPAGAPTEATTEALGGLLAAGDVVIDGGNSYFKDDVRRARGLAERGIHHLDVGTSGGVWGLERGYCMMIGGHRPSAERLDPIFDALAPGRGDIPRTPERVARPEFAERTTERGYLYCGPAGAGHFVKMIHNGIEYGLMQAYAEGFDILRAAASDQAPQDQRYDLELGEIAELWRRGSVVTSWLLDLTAAALAKSPALDEFSGVVQDSGEGRWTVEAAVERAVPAEVLTAALYTRFRSRQEHTFAEKVLSAMRLGFGGHREPAISGEPGKPGESGGGRR